MKWKPLRAAAVLYVLTALTSYAVCGTYAKYAASDTAADAARVAKWGVTVFSEGRLFGENYDGSPSNTVTQNPDGSVTVKSHHEMALGNGITTRNVIAPGTKNDTGLVFGLTGKPETAVHMDVTIKNQNIALRTGVYYFMYTVKDHVSAENFDDLVKQHGALYCKDGEDGYQKTDTYRGDTQYYYVNQSDKTDLVVKSSSEGTTYKNWPYCPVVFSLNPVSGHGLTVNEHTNSATSQIQYIPSFKDKSLDIISWTLRWVGFDVGDDGFDAWPTMDENDVFSRSISKDFPANTDLSMVRNVPIFGVANERLTWEWKIERAEDTELYNLADSMLGRLAAEKLWPELAMKDGFVVMEDRELISTSADHYAFGGLKNNGRLIRPVEFEDYCLETLFDIEITVSQVD